MVTLHQSETREPEVIRDSPRRKHTREEMLAIFRAAREEVQAANTENRDILAEFLAERRAAAANE